MVEDDIASRIVDALQDAASMQLYQMRALIDVLLGDPERERAAPMHERSVIAATPFELCCHPVCADGRLLVAGMKETFSGLSGGRVERQSSAAPVAIRGGSHTYTRTHDRQGPDHLRR